MTFIYEDGKMAVLYASMLVHSNRLGEINGTKGCIEVQNINNCEEIRVLDEKRQLVARYPVPEQINMGVPRFAVSGRESRRISDAYTRTEDT